MTHAPLALMLGIAVLLLLPWGGASGIGEVQVSLNGLSRPAAWTVLWSLAATALAAAGVRRDVSSAAWLVGAVSVGLAVMRFPVALLGLLLLAAVLLPPLSPGAAARGWARTLVIGAGAGTAVVAAGVVGRQQGDEVIATVLVVGFLAAAGAAPFGLHLARWLDEADPEVGAVVAAAFPACVLAALVASAPALAAAHAGQRMGLVLGVFGGVTAIAGAAHALAATDWRSLAARTTPFEVGLALVGVAAFDTRGLQGAALTLALLAITRPVLFLADRLGPRRGAGLAVTALALLGAAGLPPTLGFPARLMILGSATRINPLVAVLVVAAMALEVTAIALVLRRRLAQPAGENPAAHPRAVAVLATGTVVALLAGGVFPALVLGLVFRLGG